MVQSDIVVFGVINLATGKVIDGIINGIKYLFKTLDEHIYLQISFDPKINPKNAFALTQELEANHIITPQLTVTDGGKTPNYRLPPGTYKLNTSIGKVWVTLADDKVTLRTTKRCKDFYALSLLYKLLTFDVKTILDTGDEVNNNVKDLMTRFKAYYDGIYQKYNTTSKVLIFFTSEGSKWTFPIFRRPRTYKKERLGDHIKALMANVDKFMRQEKQYELDGHPYRKGYFLYGKPGSGKSASVELIAMKYEMSVYLVNLNAEHMTDTVLINLISSIPMRSLIVFEEIDKQMKTLEANTNKKISLGSILSATDGPQRLSHGTMIIMTANNNQFFGEEESEAVFRKGRIDKTYRFDEAFYRG